MNINNVIQFPKSSVPRQRARRSSWVPRLKSIPKTVSNILLTVIALIALGALSAIGWVYGLRQNRRLTGTPIVPAVVEPLPAETATPKSLSKR